MMMFNNSLFKLEQYFVFSINFFECFVFYLASINEIVILLDQEYRIILDFVIDNWIDVINYSLFNAISYVQAKVPTFIYCFNFLKEYHRHRNLRY